MCPIETSSEIETIIEYRDLPLSIAPLLHVIVVSIVLNLHAHKKISFIVYFNVFI